MAYLVMARKWRPKSFDEMVGQEHIAKTLRNAIESGRIAHAFLFTGTRGVGKTTAARILAKALNCAQGPTPAPCGTCENCLAVDQGASMDVLEIDGASNNGVENVRELREQVKYAPMQGTYKVYIIDEVHMLSKSAFNALLKTLEEPPPHVVFIFATTESGKVPHTILSRVQRFDFRRISEAAIRERLEFICGRENLRAEREALEAVARKADGSMRDALSLFDRVYAYSGDPVSLDAARKALGIPEDRLYDHLLGRLAGHDTGGCLATLGEVYHQGLEISEFLTGFGEYLRDLLFSRQEGVTPAMLGLGEPRFREMRALGGDLQNGDLLRYAKIVSDLLAGLRFSPHPRLGVELGMARMAALDRVVSLSQVLEGENDSAPPDRAPEAEAKKKALTPVSL
jgi:DNA polymerase-3 subunit gamma/tau